MIGGPLWLLYLLRFIELTSLLVITLFWVSSMQRTIAACPPSSRTTDPSSVWLIMIPVFGLVWQFVANTGVAETVAKEYKRRGWNMEENRPGFEQGMITGLVVCAVVLIRSSFAVRYNFDFVGTLVIGNLHPGFGFIGTIIIGFCMYRHMDRLASYRERLEKEPDPSLRFSQQPYFAFEQPQWQQPVSPVQNPYQQQYNAPPVYPPVQNPSAPYHQYPPQPPQNPSPDELNKWMPPGSNPGNSNPSSTDEFDRWRPKDAPDKN